MDCLVVFQRWFIDWMLSKERPRAWFFSSSVSVCSPCQTSAGHQTCAHPKQTWQPFLPCRGSDWGSRSRRDVKVEWGRQWELEGDHKTLWAEYWISDKRKKWQKLGEGSRIGDRSSVAKSDQGTKEQVTLFPQEPSLLSEMQITVTSKGQGILSSRVLENIPVPLI